MLYNVRMNITCADPGIFVRGGGVRVNPTKKALTLLFLFFFVLSLLWLISKKTIIFQGSRGAGVQLLIPYRNPYDL